MSELPKCVGTGCDRRMLCLRFRSLPAGQDVMNPPPLKPVTGACAFFMPSQGIGRHWLMRESEAEEWAERARALPARHIETRRTR